jgi:TolB-like protein/Flp pilus assembly protein TadD
MSGDPEQEYFSDGITESIIVNLSSFNGLNVKSRHTSFAFKDSAKGIDEIAAELAVQYIVEGSIRKFGDKVRITVQVDETASGNQLWGKRFESDLEDLFALEEELVKSITGSIGGRIGKDIKSASMHKSARDLKSYDYLMRGLHHLGKFNAEDVAIARTQFQKCLEHDPNSSEAHALLGVNHLTEIFENWSVERVESKRLMMLHAEKALQLEPEDAVAHAFMAEILMFSGDFERAGHHVERALELNPNLPDGYSMKCMFLASNRRYEEALEYADMSLQIDPYHFYMCWSAGEVYQECGQFERAVKTFRSMPHIPPSVQAQIAASLAGLGKTDEARAEMQRYLESARRQMPNCPANENEWRSYWKEYVINQYEEDFEHFFQLLLKAGLCDDIVAETDDTPSIAVLPFENMSGDPEQDHFADGITTDIIATLSRFKHLRTVSRHSVLPYKNQHTSISEIALQQNVRYILEGSVRKSGNSIRVSAELIDSQGEKICWSEHYDRDLDDLFAVQDEITRNIALAMKVQLDDGDMALHRSKGTSNIKAWELTLTSIDLADTYIRQNILDARVMAGEATRIDPDYAYAWISLGWTFLQEAYSGWGKPIDELILEAEKASQLAFQLDADYSEAWSQSGFIHVMKHEPDKAIEAFLKAVELEPGSAEIQALTAFAYIFNSDFEQAKKYYQNMLTLCPIRAGWYYFIGGNLEQFRGKLERAIELYQQGILVEPDSPLGRFYLIDAMLEKGDEAAAEKLADEIRALDTEVTGKGLVHVFSYNREQRNRFETNLAKFDLA